MKCTRCNAEFETQLGKKDATCGFCNMVLPRTGITDEQIKTEVVMRDALNGNAHAQYKLGQMYEKGTGVEEDLKNAYEWYLKAYQQDYKSAAFKLGFFHANGKWVPKDFKKAIAYYMEAFQADKTDKVTIGNIGHSYYRLNDGKQALKWLMMVPTYDFAQHILRHIYRDGEGVKKDLKEAFIWYSKAAAQGYTASEKEAKKILQEL